MKMVTVDYLEYVRGIRVASRGCVRIDNGDDYLVLAFDDIDEVIKRLDQIRNEHSEEV
jgi:hypothetical protein